MPTLIPQTEEAGLTLPGALITGTEIWLEHDRASSGDKLMWWPVWLSPVVSAAGLAGVFPRRAAKTTLPVASAFVVANSLQRTRRAGGR